MTNQTYTHWLTYRGSHDLERLVPKALEFYKKHYDGLPPCIRVHTSLVEATRAHVPDGIEVQGNGGTLTGEIWLPIDEQTYRMMRM